MQNHTLCGKGFFIRKDGKLNNHYSKHREKILCISKQWKKDNPSKVKAHQIAYWNRKAGIDDDKTLSPSARELLNAYHRERRKKKGDIIRAQERQRYAKTREKLKEYESLIKENTHA